MQPVTRKNVFFFLSHSNHQANDRVLEKESERFEGRLEMTAKARLALRGFRTLVG